MAGRDPRRPPDGRTAAGVPYWCQHRWKGDDARFLAPTLAPWPGVDDVVDDLDEGGA